MPTYQLISSVTVGSGGAATIDFSSIPATYTDLCVLFSLRGDRSAIDLETYVKLNNTTTGYSYRNLYGNPTLGTPVGSGNGNTYPMILANGATATASTFANSMLYIPNYAGSNNKSMSIDAVSENNASSAYTYLVAGLWSNSAAINQITLTPFSGNFVQYSTAYLYGIKNS